METFYPAKGFCSATATEMTKWMLSEDQILHNKLPLLKDIRVTILG